MTGAEKGFLLLASHLGVRDRKTLTVARFRQLAQRVRSLEKPCEERDLLPEDLERLGYDRPEAEWILKLLSEERLLERYLREASQYGCVPLSWPCVRYPGRIRRALEDEAPGVLWMKGDPSILEKPTVSLVGSRELRPQNKAFAQKVGRLAAEKGYSLVSGNARGADYAAQQACLEAGGSVICVIADRLDSKRRQDRVLYLSETDLDAGFTAVRAHSRNRLIHSMSELVFVAQSGFSGGTWSGTEKNLRKKWSRVLAFRDGSRESLALEEMGAELIGEDQIEAYL